MALSFQSKDSQVLGRQLKTQKVSIPLTIVGNATPASVSVTSGEPGILYVKTEGVDQITAALASGETATYGSSPSDSAGRFNLLVDLKEVAASVVSIRMVDLVTGSPHTAKMGSATAITTGSGSTGKVMITCTGAQALNTSNTLTSAVEVEYIIAE